MLKGQLTPAAGRPRCIPGFGRQTLDSSGIGHRVPLVLVWTTRMPHSTYPHAARPSTRPQRARAASRYHERPTILQVGYFILTSFASRSEYPSPNLIFRVHVLGLHVRPVADRSRIHALERSVGGVSLIVVGRFV